MASDLLDKFAGTIIGLAIGDAMGRPTEFLSSIEKIRDTFGPDGVTDFEADRHPAGTYTDDTQMTLAIARALIAAGHEPFEDLMERMATEFVAWRESPDNDRAPGFTCLRGCEELAKGVPWRIAGVADSKGCGSAMRTAPIGLYFHHNEKRLITVARASSLLTHGHPTALASAAATALLVAWALHDDDPNDYPRRLTTAMRKMDGEEVATLVEKIPDLLSAEPKDVLCGACLGEAWTGESAVASALWCFCRTPDDFTKTVLTGTNTAGDSDSIACIAGSISGAYLGLNAIPPHWRKGVENSQMLYQTAKELLAAHKQRVNLDL